MINDESLVEHKNAIIGILNHSISDIHDLLHGAGFQLCPVTKLCRSDKQKYLDSHLAFSSSEMCGRAYNLGLITRTPLLFETATALHRVSIHHNVFIIDADVHPDGFLDFKPIDVNRVISILNYTWDIRRAKRDTFVGVKKDSVTQHGMRSSIASCINAIFDTIPAFCYAPFMVAFAIGTNDNFQTFNTFIKDNRIVNKDNKSFFRTLDDILGDIRVYISFLASGQIRQLKEALSYANSNKIANMRMIKAYRRKYLRYNLSDYMDNEDNINLQYDDLLS